MRFPLLRFICLIFGLLTGGEMRAATNGLFADFVTSMGNFTCQLDYIHTPKTVANFVGLASGSKASLDMTTGAAAKVPFYNGSSIFRVTNEAFQAGSPSGDGTGGPGYTFPDEVNSTLTYSQAGILGMSSYPLGSFNANQNSNGSQFFVTVEANPLLDNTYTNFGNVTAGLSVVTAIGAVPVDVNGKPTTPVTINSVTIRAVGTSAMLFNAALQPLPMVGGAAPALVKDGGAPALRFSRANYNAYWLFNSSNLVNWTGQQIGLYVTAPPSGDLDVSASASGQTRQFYRVPQVAYPTAIYTPPSLPGSSLNMKLSNGDTLVLTFDNVGGGTCQYTPAQQSTSTGTITSYTWTQEAYRGVLSCFSSNLYPLLLSEEFASGTAGSFRGVVFVPANPGNISGTFTFTPPASGSSTLVESTRSVSAVPATAPIATPSAVSRAVSSAPVLLPAPVEASHLRMLPARRSHVERLEER